MKIRTRFLSMFVAAAILPLLVAGVVAYVLMHRVTVERTVASLDAYAAIQESRIDGVLDENQERLTSLATRGDVRRLMAEVEGATPERRAALRAEITAILVDALYANDAFRQVEIVDHRGEIFASTLDGRVGRIVAEDPHVLAGRDGASVNDLYLDSSGQQRFRLAGPIFQSGVRVGTAVIETDTLNLLSIISDYRALGRTGETVLARKNDDGDALVIAPLRSDPNAAMRRVIRASDRGIPVNEALRRREEVFHDMLDYRGTRVYAATRYIDRGGYGVAVKLNAEEVLQPLVPLRTLLWQSLLLALFLSTAISVYMSHKLAAPLARLTAGARRIAGGNEQTRIEPAGDDETVDLAHSFNIMVDKLLAERLRLEAAVKSIPVGIVVVGADNNVVLRNDHASHILGISALKPLTLSDVVSALPASMRLPEKFRECVKKQKIVEMKDEQVGERILRLLLSPVRTGPAGSHGFVLLLEDISEARKLERAKSDFVSVASHQLRTPLSALKGIISMIQDRDLGPVSEKQEPFINEMRHSTDRMIALVNALLNTSRIDLGIFSVEPEPTDLAELAQNSVEELAPEMRDKKQVLKMDVDQGIGKVMVDPKLMRIIYHNLLQNAVKYTPPGGRIEFEQKRKGEKLYIRVSDTGYGIPDQQQNKVFTKMFRADNARQLYPDGTGLGLYIVKAIVETSEGQIRFTSSEGAGTVFEVTLPAAGMKAKQGSKDLEEV